MSAIRIAAASGGGASGTSRRNSRRWRARSSSERQAGVTSTKRNSAARSCRSRRGEVHRARVEGPQRVAGARGERGGQVGADLADRALERRRSSTVGPSVADRPHAHDRMLTARATTRPTVISDDERLRAHQPLGGRRQRHRVGGAERGRVRERNVQVVDQPGHPVRRRPAGIGHLREQEVGTVALVPRARAGRAAPVDLPVPEPEQQHVCPHSTMPEKINGWPPTFPPCSRK